MSRALTVALTLLLPTAAHASGGLSIMPDPILMVLQAIPFALLIFLLNKLLFAPFSEYLAERDQATVGAREEALKLQQRAQAHLAEYEKKLEAARAETQRIHAEARKEALSEREAAIAAARADAEKKVADALETIAGERELAAEELRRLARSLGGEIATRILARPDGSASATH
jgi:F-type H+-transporting ATPase subunit b